MKIKQEEELIRRRIIGGRRAIKIYYILNNASDGLRNEANNIDWGSLIEGGIASLFSRAGYNLSNEKITRINGDSFKLEEGGGVAYRRFKGRYWGLLTIDDIPDLKFFSNGFIAPIKSALKIQLNMLRDVSDISMRDIRLEFNKNIAYINDSGKIEYIDEQDFNLADIGKYDEDLKMASILANDEIYGAVLIKVREFKNKVMKIHIKNLKQKLRIKRILNEDFNTRVAIAKLGG